MSELRRPRNPIGKRIAEKRPVAELLKRRGEAIAARPYIHEINRHIDALDEDTAAAHKAVLAGEVDSALSIISGIKEKKAALQDALLSRSMPPETKSLMRRISHELRAPKIRFDGLFNRLTRAPLKDNAFDELRDDFVRSDNLKVGYLDAALIRHGDKRTATVDTIISHMRDDLTVLRNNLKYLSEPAKFEEVGLNRFIDTLAAEGSLAPIGAVVRLELGKDVDKSHIDRGKMQLVLQNLVKNAAEAGAKNITILTYPGEGVRSRYSYIKVWNDNSFIPSDKRGEIFERGKTFAFGKKPGVKGTGIGLDLVKEYVENHGGRITVESDPDKRETAFIIRLHALNR